MRKAQVFATLDLTVCTVVKSKVEISQNFVAFSEYMNFTFLYTTDETQIIDFEQNYSCCHICPMCGIKDSFNARLPNARHI